MTETDSTPSSLTISEVGDREFRELADFAPVMIWRSGPDKLCDWFNRPWLDFTGRTMQQELGYGWAQGIHPDDFQRSVDTYNTAFDARCTFTMEYRLRRGDGEYRWVLDNGVPFYRDGVFAGYFGSCVDITARKDAETRQQTLIDELNHRVKNMLAVVSSLAQQSFKQSDAAEKEAFDGRLRAVAAAHDLLARQLWQAAPLHEIVSGAACPWMDAPGRVTCSGPPVMIPAATAVSLSVVIHELCTNAARYGALSDDFGRVSVTWRILDSGPRQFELQWREEGGPPVAEPGKKGFGLRMIERAFRSGENASVAMTFARSGLVCVIRATAL